MDKKQAQMNAEMSSALFSERERFEMLFADHWKKVAVIGVAVALLVALVFAAWNMTNRAATKAAHAFADAADAPALEKALAENAGKKGAVAARQRLISVYVEQKNYDGALKQVKEIMKSAEADISVRGKTAVAEGLILELKGSTKEAAAHFVKVANNASYKSAVRLEAAAAACRLMAAKDPDGAAALLDRAARITPDSQVASQHLAAVKAMQLALANGELGPKPKAKTAKAK